MMSKATSETIDVLVIFTSPRTRYSIETLPAQTSKKYNFIYQDTNGPEDHGKITFCNLQQFLDDAKEICSKRNIRVVLSSGELGALLRAALVQEYPHLRGPSIESVFLSTNKYYTHCFLDPDPIPFACLDLSNPDLELACKEALQKVGTPAFFKPCSSSSGQGVASIIGNEELVCTTRSFISSSLFTSPSVSSTFLNPFYGKHIDERRYPLSTRPIAVVEKHMGDVARINVDGYVFNGEIFHWSLSDNLYWREMPRCCFGAAIPTALSRHVQEEVWKMFDAVVSRMVTFGFDNSFVNVEVFVLESGEVRLMEVNPRKGGCVGSCSHKVFENGNLIAAELSLLEGVQPGPPISNGRHAFLGYFTTCGSGIANTLFDFNFVHPGIIPEVAPEEFIDGSRESGAILGSICLSGDSREEILEHYKSICRRVLVKPQLSFWEY